MKTLKNYLCDIRDYFTTWSRIGTGSTIASLYIQKTMLKGGHFGVFFEDRDNVIIPDVSGEVIANCQYYSQNLCGHKWFAAHIKIGSVDFLLISSPDIDLAKQSSIASADNEVTYVSDCTVIEKSGKLILRFDKRPFKLPGVSKSGFVTIAINADVLCWATNPIDPQLDRITYLSASGSDIKKFAERNGIAKPADHLYWKQIAYQNGGILKDL